MAHAYLNAGRPPRVPVQGCSKSSFDTRRLALLRMDNMNKQTEGRAVGKGRLNVYRCSSCKLWHIGHKPLRGQRKERDQ